MLLVYRRTVVARDEPFNADATLQDLAGTINMLHGIVRDAGLSDVVEAKDVHGRVAKTVRAVAGVVIEDAPEPVRRIVCVEPVPEYVAQPGTFRARRNGRSSYVVTAGERGLPHDHVLVAYRAPADGERGFWEAHAAWDSFADTRHGTKRSAMQNARDLLVGRVQT